MGEYIYIPLRPTQIKTSFLSLDYNMSYSPSYPPPHGPPPPGFPVSPQPGFHVGSTYPGQSPSFNPPPRSGPSPGGGSASAIETTGAYEGAQFRIAHRDSNSLLSVRLQPGYELKAKPGSMVAMDASVKIKGKVSYNHTKMKLLTELSSEQLKFRLGNLQPRQLVF